ncbi:hypothetical protein A3C96_01610 [Candidatus Uhrbacteria bacterium RIFCSPHIGHO2_02_FULL_60_10]|uniref:Uncharacterized protein n=1 Tax=Candidatus Uhrbacteria bacterium RIFCSPHIGHO2_02_FULL_60_10 TaxID=1802392 RepID=A0A1F7U8C1_9BACT|nr:MAG: hypothetical protein A3C96_01610 [Candidatus Uhrbacteria bacterium RIFCSPHIGHO2_02_FULL_60_10]
MSTEAKNENRLALAIGLILTVFVGATLLTGYFSGIQEGVNPAWIASAALAAGATAVFLLRFRLYAWFIGWVLGVVIGTTSALDMILGPAFEKMLYVSLMTVVVFAGLGFLAGAAGELVRYAHRVSHRFGGPLTAKIIAPLKKRP